MKDFSSDLAELRRRIGEAAQYLNIETSRGLLVELEGEVAKPDLWNDQEHAKKVNSQYVSLKADIDQFNLLSATIDDLCVLHELARAEDDATQEPELEKGVASCRSQLDSLEMRSMFTGEHDECDVILQINAKDGGVDAQDWSEMLLRMYRRWAERRGFAFEIGDVSIGTEAGILSADVTIRGRYAYGLLTSERGTHRLVRISPFDNQGRRQTSFALVQIWPILDQAELEINESDIRMEVFRASGAGGQHVNKTSSAVRLTHKPSGIVVTCQNERSQTQNREVAMKILKSRLLDRRLAEVEAEQRRLRGEPMTAGFGNSIRSYVLHPYNLVKDNRTSFETSNTQGVLDGDLDAFMEAWLEQQIEA